ncbi:MAG: hypothetical protein JWR56_985 [Massilia sp.]|nr:hypothetical protein [Massilia sp.]
MDSIAETNMETPRNGAAWLYKRPRESDALVTLVMMFLVWAAVAVFLSYHHAFWRDEVRALSHSLQGENTIEMLKSIHGESHPAIWYLALRGMHWIVGTPEALNYTALLVAATAIGVFLVRSPFRLLVIALFLFGGISAFEFSAMARNYGISMLFLFLFAATYSKKREAGYWSGATLFLLANTNVHSAILAAVLVGFWFLDSALEKKSIRLALSKNFLINAGIAIAGIVVCFLTVYPTYNDAAIAPPPLESHARVLFRAVFNPSAYFSQLLPFRDITDYVNESRAKPLIPAFAVSVLTTLTIYGSTLGLIRRPAAFLAALAALIGFSIFFAFIYEGGFRHQALWVIFLIVMYWISSNGTQSPLAVKSSVQNRLLPVARIGSFFFCVLLLLQLPKTAVEIARGMGYGVPLSQSEEVAKLINSDPMLRKATIMSDPDFMIEPFPYYLPDNPTYVLREDRFGKVTRFTKYARLRIGLDEILNEARKVRATTGQPVIILLSQKLDGITSDVTIPESYNWELTVTPSQVKHFTDSTRLIAKAIPTKDVESYNVYVID